MARPLIAWRQAAVEWVTLHPSREFTCQELFDELTSEGNAPPSTSAVSTFLSQWAVGRYPAHTQRGLRFVGPCTYTFERGKPNKARGIKRGSKRADLVVLPGELLEYIGTGHEGELIYRDPDTHRLYTVAEL